MKLALGPHPRAGTALANQMPHYLFPLSRDKDVSIRGWQGSQLSNKHFGRVAL